MNWYGNTSVSEEGSSSTPKILRARLHVLKEVKIKVVFWIVAVALSLVSTYFTETSGLDVPIFYRLQILSRGEIIYKDFYSSTSWIYITNFQQLHNVDQQSASQCMVPKKKNFQNLVYLNI